MEQRVEKMKTGRMLTSIEGKKYPEIHSVIITKIDNPHVAKDTKKAIQYYKKVKQRNKKGE